MSLLQKKQRRKKLNSYISEALSAFYPPEKLTVSKWAEKYRILDSRTSALPGQWSNTKTPYLKEIMDELNNPYTEEIVFVKPTQVGGTESLMNMLGYCIDNDPGPALVVYPTDKLAETNAENRIAPMVELSPKLRSQYKMADSSRLEMRFKDCFVSIVGANSPSSLASRPIRYLFLDEIDKYPGASTKEADALSLAEERTKTFDNRKVFKTSTPTVKNGNIWKALQTAEVVKHYEMPCPHCGEMIEFDFKNLLWAKEESMSDADRAKSAYYCCQICGGIIRDRHKPAMLRNGRWTAVEKKTNNAKSIAYWMNTLYSPFVTFEEVAKEFLDSKDDPELLQNFINSWLAEPWEDAKLVTDAETVMKMQTEVPKGKVPAWAQMLTGGVDVQENYMYYTIRAWGPNMTSQNILHGQALGWSDVEYVMNAEYAKENGTGKLIVCLCGVDSGDQTEDVYDFCDRNREWAIPVKGSSHSLDYYKISRINRSQERGGGTGITLMLVDTNKYKTMIASRLNRELGKGAFMVYKGCDDDYAEQLTSEHMIESRKAGKLTRQWVKKTTRAANHYFDCEVYASAAADAMSVRTLVEVVTEVKAKANSDSNEAEHQANENSWSWNDDNINSRWGR